MTEREVKTGVDVSDEFPNTYRVFAECADEYTELVLMNVEVPDMVLLQKTALRTHQDRCEACQAWAKMS